MLRRCSASLPQRRKGEEDIDLIRRALARYLDTWVLPVLDTIQDGRARNPQWVRAAASLHGEPWGARMSPTAISPGKDPRLPDSKKPHAE
jgi:hypothetical protein